MLAEARLIERPVAGRVQWLTGRSSKFGQTFGLFQGPLQHDRQYRLSNEGDWLVGQKCGPCWFVQIRAEKYAPPRLLRVQAPDRIDAAATLRKANIHQNHIWIVCGRLRDPRNVHTSLPCQERTLGARQLKASRTSSRPNPACKRSPVTGCASLVLTLMLACSLYVPDALRLGQPQNALVVRGNRAITFAGSFLELGAVDYVRRPRALWMTPSFWSSRATRITVDLCTPNI